MSSKLKIRIGDVEIDYEGTEEFLKQELPQLLKTAMELHRAGVSPSGAGAGGGKGGTKGNIPTLTTSSIAAKLGVKSGPDLVVAAAAHLSLVKKTEPFTREQLLDEMKLATGHYKKTMSSNLTNHLKSVLKEDHLAEVSTGSYALTAAKAADLEKKLANA